MAIECPSTTDAATALTTGGAVTVMVVVASVLQPLASSAEMASVSVPGVELLIKVSLDRSAADTST